MNVSEVKLRGLPTRWTEKVRAERIPHLNYPRPQMKRAKWICLNGMWSYAITDADQPPQRWDGGIRVPFSPECLLSDVERSLKPGQTLWYERSFKVAKPTRGGRMLLHFGAVDQVCTVWLNGELLGGHEGGYHPFSFDVTNQLSSDVNRLRVQVTDASDQGQEPYGKQRVRRGGIWYTGQSGIWQTVWMESVPEVSVSGLKITPKYNESQVEIGVDLTGEAPVCVKVLDGETPVAETKAVDGKAVLDLPGFHPWSCEDPFLYRVIVEAGEDRVESYFGMRVFGVMRGNHGRKVLTLNGKPIFHHGLLDQGYWSDGMYTPPCDEAMVWEIRRLKELGFNMLRKHIKIEPLRWYYHCDRLGMLVWQDFVNGGERESMLTTALLPMLGMQMKDHNYKTFGRASREGREIYWRDVDRTMDLLGNCVSLCCWVPFNEGWGQFDAARTAAYVKEKDPSRYVDHASGWHDQGAGDFQSSHIYFKPFKPREDVHDRVMALTEFGGYSMPVEGHMASERLFGYKKFSNRVELQKALFDLYYHDVMTNIRAGLAASVYTQVSDVEDEINGLFTYDREKEKVDAAQMLSMGGRIQSFFESVVRTPEEVANAEETSSEEKAD